MNRNFKIPIALCGLLVMLAGCAADLPMQENAASPAVVSDEPLDVEVLADSGNPVLELIADSYSAGAFAEGDIADLDIERILTSGAKAPSAKNAQPWHFTVIKDHEIASRLLSHAKKGNVVIVISGNRDIVTDTMQFDCGLAAGNMQLAAESLGLGARLFIEPVQEIEKNQRTALDIPDGYDVLAALLIGHTDESVDAVSSATPRTALPNIVNYVP